MAENKKKPASKPKAVPAKKKGKGKGKPKAAKRAPAGAVERVSGFSAAVRDAIANASEPIARHELIALLGGRISEEKAIKVARDIQAARERHSGKARVSEPTRQSEIDYGRGYLITHALGGLRRAGEIKRTFGSGKDKATQYFEITKKGKARIEKTSAAPESAAA